MSLVAILYITTSAVKGTDCTTKFNYYMITTTTTPYMLCCPGLYVDRMVS
jgi:hypothetical protein